LYKIIRLRELASTTRNFNLTAAARSWRCGTKPPKAVIFMVLIYYPKQLLPNGLRLLEYENNTIQLAAEHQTAKQYQPK
jgi:hypothetical protein